MADSTASEHPEPHSASNLVVLVGSIVADPTIRDVPDGAAWQFDVVTTIPSERGTRRATVPVNWLEPPSRDIESLRAGEEVIVVGSIQRRFFRVGGVTQSRTEVVPDRVVPLRRRATVRSMMAAAAGRLT